MVLAHIVVLAFISVLACVMVFSCVIVIHPKRWCPRLQDFADNFSQKDCLRLQKVSRLHCLQSHWQSFPQFMFIQNVQSKLSIKTLKHTIFLTKNATLTPCSCDFYDFVRIYASFPQIFGDWKVESADFFTFSMNGIVFGCGGVSPSYGDNSYPGFSLCYGVSLIVLVLYYNTSLRFGVSLCYTVCLCYCDLMPYVWCHVMVLANGMMLSCVLVLTCVTL